MHRVYCILRLVIVFCMTASASLHAAQNTKAAASHTLWVMGNGFHSAFVLRTTDAEPLLKSSVRDPKAQWVAVGWGDRDFFMAKRATLWITIKAVCWPTPSALHIIPLRNPPEAIYRNSDIIRLKLTPDRFARLQNYLESQFATDRQGRPIFLGAGFTERSSFFLGSESFYFPKMCNYWVARGLHRSGLPVSPLKGITSFELIKQVKKHGVRTGARRLPVDGF